jgi:putative lipoic acid-binding regulatory protein
MTRKPKIQPPKTQTSQSPNDVDLPRPKVEFPCDYPIRVVGDAAEDFVATVSKVIERHAPGFDPASVKLTDSRNARFQSIRVVIHATGEAQLDALFQDLKATGRVHMVL